MTSPDEIKPFKINVPDAEVDSFKERLSRAKFPNELEDSGWDYGVPLSDVKRLTKFWKDEFDWKVAEAKLNALPQYTTSIQCESFEPLKLHFVHKRSTLKNAIPLLFVHGWPGSFIEVSKILDPLTSGSPAFEVVAPSLPNYGFSEGSLKTGFGLAQYAETCHKLMLRLGYNQYVTQGGDWGFYVTRTISLLYPTSCLATHVNMPHGSFPSPIWSPFLFLRTLPSYLPLLASPSRARQSFARTQWFLTQGSGYRAEQSTKPQTLAYALDDSPVALLAWIYEKLHDWTDAYPWTDAEICTWIAIYAFSTMGPGAASRIYYEALNPSPRNNPPGRVTTERLTQWIPRVKIGLSEFPQELFKVPRAWASNLGNVVFWADGHEKGGHFAAWERPGEIVGDLRRMFGKGGEAEAVVEKRTGL